MDFREKIPQKNIDKRRNLCYYTQAIKQAIQVELPGLCFRCDWKQESVASLSEITAPCKT